MSDGSTNWGSAIMLILQGTKEEHLNMLEGGIIAKLLDEKWSTYAKVSAEQELEAKLWFLGVLHEAADDSPAAPVDHVDGGLPATHH